MSSNSPLGVILLKEPYSWRFYAVEDQKIAARFYRGNDKIAGIKLTECSTEIPVFYKDLPKVIRDRLEDLLKRKDIQLSLKTIEVKKPDKTDKKIKAKVFPKKLAQEPSSDDENLGFQGGLFIFQRTSDIPAAAMTVSCKGQNIKGSRLIEIAHNEVDNFYSGAVDYACEYERDLGGAAIPSPTVKDGILHIQAPREWFMTLGGWKGMMPSKEIPEYFFSRSSSSSKEVENGKFTGVCFYQNTLCYPIVNHRIHLPEQFSISGKDITEHWKKENGKWVKTPNGKTDLSYSQIVVAIEHIKGTFQLQDWHLAFYQIFLLIGSSLDDDFESLVPDKKNQTEIIQFLSYLNGLMFGIEASGLNVALVTSLMILDLITQEKVTYEKAFKANEDGGIYPYACFGDNRGTYTAREKILSSTEGKSTEYSMKEFRNNPSLSPVAVKEATLIKYWLISKGVVSAEKKPYDEQENKIRLAICELIFDSYASH